MSTPACPAWCTRDHDRWDDPGKPILGHTRWELDEPLTGIIWLRGEDRPRLSVGAVDVDIDQAEPMAVLMAELGRADIAAAIRRLTAHLDESSD